MANPQLENGHLGIANEIVEVLARTHLNGYESRYLWALWRKTYCWHKKNDVISNSQFVQMTNIKRTHIWRTQKGLIARNIVTKNGNKLSFNKDYSQWRDTKVLPKMVHVTKNGTEVTKNGTEVTKNGAYKRNYTKETIQKKGETIQKKGSDVPSQDIQTFISAFKDVNPSYEMLFRNKTERDSAKRLILKYGIQKMLSTITALPEIISKPYAPKIISPYSLERDLGKLIAFVNQEKNKLTIKKSNIVFS